MKDQYICIGNVLSAIVMLIFVFNINWAEATWMGCINYLITIVAFTLNVFTILHYIVNGFRED